jgi:hypothetical protein
MEDPVRAVNNFRSRSPLHAHGFASRMRWIWFNRDQPIAIDGIQCPATGAAKCAIAMDHGCHWVETPDNSALGLAEQARELKIFCTSGRSAKRPEDFNKRRNATWNRSSTATICVVHSVDIQLQG